jgi:hypothetical protein
MRIFEGLQTNRDIWKISGVGPTPPRLEDQISRQICTIQLPNEVGQQRDGITCASSYETWVEKCDDFCRRE